MAAAKGKIAVIGAGLIGRAWAIVFARGGHPVALFDADPAASRRAIDVIAGGLRDLAAHDLLAEAPVAVLARIAVATRIEAAIADAVLVQENGPETIAAKQELFATLDRMAPEATILASSTSTIPASVFTESLAGRSRCLVAHPVNPPYLVPLVELAPAPWTAAEVVARARALYAGLGQTPILVKREIPGFILNRLQAALLAEAFRLVEDDFVSIDDLDKTLSDGLGLRWSFMGPFETIELNAPGGVRDYVARYGQAIYELAKTQADPRPWNAALVDRIERERRAVLPAADLAARQAWRDRRLMALAAHKRDAAKHEQES